MVDFSLHYHNEFVSHHVHAISIPSEKNILFSIRMLLQTIHVNNCDQNKKKLWREKNQDRYIKRVFLVAWVVHVFFLSQVQPAQDAMILVTAVSISQLHSGCCQFSLPLHEPSPSWDYSDDYESAWLLPFPFPISRLPESINMHSNYNQFNVLLSVLSFVLSLPRQNGPLYLNSEVQKLLQQTGQQITLNYVLLWQFKLLN